MRIELQESEQESGINWQSWSTVLHGDPLDDRGRTVLRNLTARTTRMTAVRYSPESLQVGIDATSVVVDDLATALAPLLNGRVLLESTTLGLAEIVLCCKALRKLGHDGFDIVYVEPKDYHSPRRQLLLHKRDFELSGEVPGYAAIPGSAVHLGERKPIRSIFFLGYEEARLRRAFEEVQIENSDRTSVTFGVPAFKAGWEMDAMANNIAVIREQNIRGGVHYCGAENPHAVFELLNEVYHGLDVGERMVLAPIGTKPHGIGVALFAAVHDDVGIIYDHPKRTPGRSSETGHWHLFAVESFQAVP